MPSFGVDRGRDRLAVTHAGVFKDVVGVAFLRQVEPIPSVLDVDAEE